MGREPHSEILPGVCVDRPSRIIARSHIRSHLQRLALDLSDATHLPIEVDPFRNETAHAVQAAAVSAGLRVAASQQELITASIPYSKKACWQCPADE